MGSGFSPIPVLDRANDRVLKCHLAAVARVRHAISMPRKPRADFAGAIQHVVARGVAGTGIVVDDDDRRMLVAFLARAAERSGWLVHAYCLMDTHLHAVVETPEATLSSGMQRLLGGYAFEFNRRHGRYGALFAGRFSQTLVTKEPHALEVAAYIVLNPVRAGLVREPEDWPWSSYRASAGLIRAPAFLSTELVPRMLDPDQSRSRGLYRLWVRDVAERPRPRSG